MIRRVATKDVVNILMTLGLAALLGLYISVRIDRSRTEFFTFGDLRAFYCAAQVAGGGSDVYRAEPLGACERALVEMPASNIVLPAPLPGHAIAVLQPLATVAFPIASIIWSVCLLIAFFACSGLLTRLTRFPYIPMLVTALPLGCLIPIDLGQLVPIAVILLVGATALLSCKNDRAAALLTAVATIEPHIGLPVCIALFVGRPRTRPVFVFATTVFAILCIHTVGLHETVEYVMRVLPEHISAEARYDAQYSLTYLLSSLGAPLADAVRIGQLSYWLIATAGIAVAIRLTSFTQDERFLMFVPMAFSVIGGPYVHEAHLYAAIPLAILLVTSCEKRLKPLFIVALALVAWPARFIFIALDVPAIVTRINLGNLTTPAASMPLLADSAWAARIASNTGHALPFATKFPAWIGLSILLAGTTIRVCASKRLTKAVRTLGNSIATGAHGCAEELREA